MKKLFAYLRPYRKETVISPLFKLLEACFDLMVPLVVKEIVDVGIANGDKPYIVAMCGVLVAFAVIGLSCTLVAQYYAARAATGFGTDLRRDLFAHIQRLSYSETDRQGTSTLITRMTADINQLQSGVNMTLRLFLRSPIIVLGAMIMAFTVNASSALVFVIIIPLLSAVVFTIMIKSIPLFGRVQKNLDAVTSRTRENLTGVRVLRAFRKEDAEVSAFEEVNDAHYRIQNFVGGISALANTDPISKISASNTCDGDIHLGIVGAAAATISVNENHFTTVKKAPEHPRAKMEFADIDLAYALFNGTASTINELCKGNIRLAGMISMVDNVNRILDRIAVYLA